MQGAHDGSGAQQYISPVPMDGGLLTVLFWHRIKSFADLILQLLRELLQMYQSVSWFNPGQ